MVKVIKCAEVDKRKNSVYENFIDKQKQRIDILGWKNYSYRYRLSSNAILTNIYICLLNIQPYWAFIYGLKCGMSLLIMQNILSVIFIQNYLNIEITGNELFNEIFGLFEQISEIQVQLLGIISEMLVGGFAEVYVSIGGSGSSLGMPLG